MFTDSFARKIKKERGEKLKKKEPELPLDDDKRKVAVVEPQEVVMTTPSFGDRILEAAKDESLDVDKLEKLIGLMERREAKEAERAFNEAMARAQAEIPPIVAKAKNTHTKSTYAPLEDINREVMPIISKHGLSVSFRQGKSDIEGYVRVLADVSHSGGHTRSNLYVDLPLDDKGAQGKLNKTAVHATGSTFSYSQRYLVKMIFNVSIIGEDDDGNIAGKPESGLSEAQVQEIMKLVGDDGDILDKLCTAYKVEFLGQLDPANFNQFKNRVQKERQRKKESQTK